MGSMNTTTIFGLLVLVSSVTGAKITMETTPPSFIPLLTSSLTLKCAIGDTLHTTRDATIGGADFTQVPSSPPVNRRSFRTGSEIKYVTSLVVSRDGQNIATISEHFLPTALGDLGNLKVSGTMRPSTGEMASLTLTWADPIALQQGNLTCKVSGYDAIGQNVVYYGSAVIQQAAATIDHLVYHAHAQGIKIDKLIEKNGELEQELQDQDNTINNMETQLLQRDNDINELRTEFRVHDIKSNLTISKITQELDQTNAKLGKVDAQCKNFSDVFTQTYEKQELINTDLQNMTDFLNSQKCASHNTMSSTLVAAQLNFLEHKTNVSYGELVQTIQDYKNELSHNLTTLQVNYVTIDRVNKIEHQQQHLLNLTNFFETQAMNLSMIYNMSNTELLNKLDYHQIKTNQTLSALNVQLNQCVTKDQFENQQNNMFLNLTKTFEAEVLDMNVTSSKHQQYIDNITKQLTNLTLHLNPVTMSELAITKLTADITRLRACTSPRVAFSATFKDHGSVFVGAGHTVKYDQILENTAGGYDVTTGRFTCPVPGLYSFTVTATVNTDKYACLDLRRNGVYVTTLVAHDTNYKASASTGLTLTLGLGDHVEVVSCNDPTLLYQFNIPTNTFTGHLVHGDVCL